MTLGVLPMAGTADDGHRARAFVEAVARCRGFPDEVVQRAVQVTGELLGHQVGLGRRPAAVSCRMAGPALQVGVHLASVDGGAAERQGGTPTAEHSRRRLRLVTALADSWGVETGDGEATWWFRVQGAAPARSGAGHPAAGSLPEVPTGLRPERARPRDAGPARGPAPGRSG